MYENRQQEKDRKTKFVFIPAGAGKKRMLKMIAYANQFSGKSMFKIFYCMDTRALYENMHNKFSRMNPGGIGFCLGKFR
jgi:hypothetical protein